VGGADVRSSAMAFVRATEAIHGAMGIGAVRTRRTP
jgi:hypothetical protein